MLKLCDIKNKTIVTEYLRANLNADGIAATLLKVLKLNPTIKELVPSGTTSESISRLDHGGFTETSKTYAWVCSRLKFLSYAEWPKTGTFIAQDNWMTKSVYLPPFSDIQTNIFFFSERPYFWIPCSKLEIKTVTSLLNSPSSHVALYAYSTYSLKLNIVKKGTDILASEMELLTKEIREYYVSAFDRDSFIVISMV